MDADADAAKEHNSNNAVAANDNDTTEPDSIEKLPGPVPNELSG